MNDFHLSGMNKEFSNQDLVKINMSSSGGVTGWLISEELSPIPQKDDDRWVENQPNEFTLSPGDGERRLYIWVKDDNGRMSNRADDSILLDTHPPNLPEFIHATTPIGVPWRVSSITASWERAHDSEGGSGISGYGVIWNGAPVFRPHSVNLDADAVSSSSGPLTPGVWFLHFIVFDNAGNRSESKDMGPFIVEDMGLFSKARQDDDS